MGDTHINEGCGVKTWEWDSLCLHFLFVCHRDPFRAHREHMRQMMRSFSEPFGGPIMPSIMDGRRRGRDPEEHLSSSQALREEHRVRMCISKSTFAVHLLVNWSSRQQSPAHIITVFYVNPGTWVTSICIYNLSQFGAKGSLIQLALLTLSVCCSWACNHRRLVFGGSLLRLKWKLATGSVTGAAVTVVWGPCESLV